MLLTDGPAAEIKEHFGGYSLVECADLDEALKWAATSRRRGRARWRCGRRSRWWLALSSRPDSGALGAVFRAHWWAAVAAVTRQVGDLEVAEDAVQDACAAALAQWPAEGVPAQPARLADRHRAAQGTRLVAAGTPPR